MRRYTQAIFFISIFLAAGGLVFYLYLSDRIQPKASTEPVRFRTLTVGDSQNSPQTTNEPTARLASGLELRPTETLLDIYPLSTDSHNTDQVQILIVRDTTDPFGYLRVIASTYAPNSRQWIRAWEGLTLATKIRTFQLRTIDVTGDFTLSLICTGINDKNEQTMTVFRQSTPAGQLFPMDFVQIFAAAGDNILLEERDRPDSYKLGLTKANSYNISIWLRDTASANQLDQIKETWTWDAEDLEFRKTAIDRIPGMRTEQLLVNRILDGQLETFTAFLDGIWYKESTNPLGSDGLFLSFQPDNGTILFATPNSVEAMEWETSNLTRYGVYIATRNQSVRNLKRLLNVELIGPDSIDVRIFQDMRIKIDIDKKWDGRYRKLPIEIAQAFRRSPAMAKVLNESMLQGSFISNQGSLLSFNGNTYQMTKTDALDTGIFNISQLGDSRILNLQSTSETDPNKRRRSYQLNLKIQKQNDEMKEILELKPIQFTIDGWTLLNEAALEFERLKD